MEMSHMEEDYNKLIKERINSQAGKNRNKKGIDKNRILLEEMERTRKISRKLKERIEDKRMIAFYIILGICIITFIAVSIIDTYRLKKN